MATLCLHAICPYGYGTHVHGSGTHTLGPRTCSLLAVHKEKDYYFKPVLY